MKPTTWNRYQVESNDMRMLAGYRPKIVETSYLCVKYDRELVEPSKYVLYSKRTSGKSMVLGL